MTDLQAKYQRLAAEYSKIRAQIPVLKKAVIDEKSSQDQLKEDLREKEQSVRKSNQEIDSLTFRNQQLSKRVLFLQEELDTLKTTKKKHKGKDDHGENEQQTASANNVFSEELQGKIEDNARLHKALVEAGAQYEERIRALEASVLQYESESSTHQQALTSTLTANKAHVDKLVEDRAMLEVKLQNVETELKNANIRAQQAESSLSSVRDALQTKLDNSQRIIDSNLPFIDNEHKTLNSLNVLTHDRKHQLRVKELVQQSVVLVRALMSALSNFFTYTEQRSQIYPTDSSSEAISPVNVKFCQHLRENANYTRPVEKCLENFLSTLREDHLTILDTATELQPFGSQFCHLVQYMDKILPYMIKSLEEESTISACPATLEKKNKDVIESIRRLFSCFGQTGTYVTIIACQSQASTKLQHPRTNHGTLFKRLSACVSKLHDTARDLWKQYNSKVSLEHQLPTATQQLKTTDECVVSALVSLVTSTGKLATYISANEDSFTQPAGYRSRGGSSTHDSVRRDPAVTSFKEQTSDYLTSLYTPVGESVPYKTAIQNRRILLSSSESRDSLAHQLSALQSQMSDMGQEKERFLLELQLLRIKYEKELQRNEDLERQMDGRVTYVDSIQANVDHAARTDSLLSAVSGRALSDIPSELGVVEEIGAVRGDADGHEALIKSHFTSRINELAVQLQMADSKAVNFHAEVRALHKRLRLSERHTQKAEEDMKAACSSLSQLNDELHTTSKSYEGQLSMMSEHLAGMNDKLAEQKEEIDNLRAQLASSRGGKKLIPGLRK